MKETWIIIIVTLGILLIPSVPTVWREWRADTWKQKGSVTALLCSIFGILGLVAIAFSLVR